MARAGLPVEVRSFCPQAGNRNGRECLPIWVLACLDVPMEPAAVVRRPAARRPA